MNVHLQQAGHLHTLDRLSAHVALEDKVWNVLKREKRPFYVDQLHDLGPQTPLTKMRREQDAMIAAAHGVASHTPSGQGEFVALKATLATSGSHVQESTPPPTRKLVAYKKLDNTQVQHQEWEQVAELG